MVSWLIPGGSARSRMAPLPSSSPTGRWGWAVNAAALSLPLGVGAPRPPASRAPGVLESYPGTSCPLPRGSLALLPSLSHPPFSGSWDHFPNELPVISESAPGKPKVRGGPIGPGDWRARDRMEGWPGNTPQGERPTDALTFRGREQKWVCLLWEA